MRHEGEPLAWGDPGPISRHCLVTQKMGFAVLDKFFIVLPRMLLPWEGCTLGDVANVSGNIKRRAIRSGTSDHSQSLGFGADNGRAETRTTKAADFSGRQPSRGHSSPRPHRG